jgi:predicted Fe-S protein YdhL (DUF1289 family)
MEQLDFIGVASPCVGICSMNDSGYCKGCMRKRDERFQWNSFSDAQKQHVIKLCRQRYVRARRKQSQKSAPSDVTSPSPQQPLF